MEQRLRQRNQVKAVFIINGHVKFQGKRFGKVLWINFRLRAEVVRNADAYTGRKICDRYVGTHQLGQQLGGKLIGRGRNGVVGADVGAKVHQKKTYLTWAKFQHDGIAGVGVGFQIDRLSPQIGGTPSGLLDYSQRNQAVADIGDTCGAQFGDCRELRSGKVPQLLNRLQNQTDSRPLEIRTERKQFVGGRSYSLPGIRAIFFTI